MERVVGIEPTSSAWKAEVLPLNYTRLLRDARSSQAHDTCFLVEGEGFEPSKAEPADLQSAPFDRSGTPPAKPRIITRPRIRVNSRNGFCRRRAHSPPDRPGHRAGNAQGRSGSTWSRGRATVRLTACSTKLDFTSATPSSLRSLSSTNREKWSRSGTTTRSR